MDKIDIDNINKKVYEIGRLKKDIIDMFELGLDEKMICFSDDKIKYTEKHKSEFDDEEQYKKSIEATPHIIDSPDYVAIHPNKNSIEYIKKIDQIMLVAVRIKQHGALWVKSVYPISQAKLDIYINAGTAKKICV